MKKIIQLANYDQKKEYVNTNLNRQGEYYTPLVCIYALILIAAQVMGHRMIFIFNMIEPGGIFIFPSTYTIVDVITEVYGLRQAKKAIYYAMIAQGVFTLLTFIIIHLPQPPNWQEGDAFQVVFNYSVMVFLSNVTAAFVSYIYNAKIIFLLKNKFQNMRFGIRSFISTTVGELLSTGVIVAISFGINMPFHDSFQLFVNMMLFKLVYAFFAMFPASYLVSFLMKKEFNFINRFINKESDNVVVLKS